MVKTLRKHYAVIVLILATVLLLFGLLRYRGSLQFSCVIQVRSDQDLVWKLGDNYVYINDNGVFACEDNRLLADLNGRKMLQMYDDTLYVYYPENGEVGIFSYSHQYEKQAVIAKDLTVFARMGTQYVTMDADGAVQAFDWITHTECSVETVGTIAKHDLKILKTNEAIMVVSDTVQGGCAFHLFEIGSDEQFHYHDAQGYHVLDYNEDKILAAWHPDFSSNYLYSFSSENDQQLKKTKIGYGCLTTQFIMEDGVVVYAGMQEPKDPLLSESEMQELKNHDFYDRIVIADAKTLEILSEYKTKQRERVIYADARMVVTYYQGEYQVYSLQTWEVVHRQSADAVKDGGSYVFDACGDFIFVFDNENGTVVDRIALYDGEQTKGTEDCEVVVNNHHDIR